MQEILPSPTPIQRRIETVVTNRIGYSDRFRINRHNWRLSIAGEVGEMAILLEVFALKASIGLLDLRSRQLDVIGFKKFVELEKIRVDTTFDPDYLEYYKLPVEADFPVDPFLRSLVF